MGTESKNFRLTHCKGFFFVHPVRRGGKDSVVK